MKLSYSLTLIAALPFAAQAADYAYGYEKAQAKTIDENGNVSQTTVEKTWGAETAPVATSAKTTDVNAPADAQPVSNMATAPSEDESASQHSADWYQDKLRPGERYVFNPNTGKLEPAANNASVQHLNAKALEKKTDK